MPPMPVFEVSSQSGAKPPSKSQGSRKGKEKASEVIVLDSDAEEEGKAAQASSPEGARGQRV